MFKVSELIYYDFHNALEEDLLQEGDKRLWLVTNTIVAKHNSESWVKVRLY